jgi:hypothetical protein
MNGTEMRYLVDKNRNYAQVIEEYSQNGAVNAAYSYEHHLISQRRNQATSYYLSDALGSTRGLADCYEMNAFEWTDDQNFHCNKKIFEECYQTYNPVSSSMEPIEEWRSVDN